MRRYRRNGTPIGKHRVYAVLPCAKVKVWELSGYSTWEEVEAGLPLEVMMGKFGSEGMGYIVAIMPGAKLDHSFFGHAALLDANLSGADLEESSFYCANLSGADLTGANLRGVCLMGAYLMGANLSRSNLMDAELQNANLWCAKLKNARLDGANLSGTHLVEADLGGVDLDGLKRLDSDHPIPGWRVVNGRLRRA